MSATKPLGPPVSDEELMSFLDGELGQERRDEVEEQLAGDQDGRDKLAGMDWVGGLLRELAAADERADGIADAVMARLDSPLTGDEEASEQDATKGAEVVPLPTRKYDAVPRVNQPRAANDNAKSIFALAAAAAAVAAGLYFWSRAGVEDLTIADGRPVPAATAVAAVDSNSSTAAAEPKWPHPAPVEEAIEEPTAAVEVASVDFGSHTGSVFYVSTGPDNAATTTAVVWVTDDVTGDAP